MNFANFSADSNDFLSSNQDNLCNRSTPCGGIGNSDPKCRYCNDVAKFHPVNGCLKFSQKKVKKDSIFKKFGNSVSHSIRYVSRKITSVVTTVVFTCLNHYVEFSCALCPVGIYYYDKDLFQKHQSDFMGLTTMSLLAAKLNYTLSIGAKVAIDSYVQQELAPPVNQPLQRKSNFGFDLRGSPHVTEEKLADHIKPYSENVTVIEYSDSNDSTSDSSEYQKIEA